MYTPIYFSRYCEVQPCANYFELDLIQFYLNKTHFLQFRITIIYVLPYYVEKSRAQF